jgi:hypothetical protein
MTAVKKNVAAESFLDGGRRTDVEAGNPLERPKHGPQCYDNRGTSEDGTGLDGRRDYHRRVNNRTDRAIAIGGSGASIVNVQDLRSGGE